MNAEQILHFQLQVMLHVKASFMYVRLLNIVLRTMLMELKILGVIHIGFYGLEYRSKI